VAARSENSTTDNVFGGGPGQESNEAEEAKAIIPLPLAIEHNRDSIPSMMKTNHGTPSTREMTARA
jgi:hypothetical protein